MGELLENYARYQYFPISYAQGREWFKEAVRLCGGHYTAYNKPGFDDLAQDLAWIGSRDAKKVFVSICGTHGQEYFAGAAGQISWLCNNKFRDLPRDVAICFIHGLNPYGAATFSRCNENFVDLNRNYRDSSEPLRPVPLFKPLSDILSCEDMNEHTFYDVMHAYNAFVERHDKTEVMTAIAGGQDEFPDSIAYAGQEMQWEIANLKMIIDSYFQHIEKACLIDWHTGLGKFGEPTSLLNLPPESREFALGRSWWGDPASSDDIYDTGAEPDYVGHVSTGFANDLKARDISVVETVIEFGTVSNRAIIPAFLVDRWLRFECADRNAPHAVKMQTIMMERYNPSLPEWRDKVLKHSTTLYEATINGLASWE